MELQEIDLFIDPDGQVRLELRGFKGQGCLGATRGLESALGGELISRQMTPEAAETSQNVTEANQWQWGG
jgi:hypothetical protein